MKNLAKKFEAVMMAVTFAEAGEDETAREILRESDRQQKTDRITPSKKAEKQVLRASPPNQ